MQVIKAAPVVCFFLVIFAIGKCDKSCMLNKECRSLPCPTNETYLDELQNVEDVPPDQYCRCDGIKVLVCFPPQYPWTEMVYGSAQLVSVLFLLVTLVILIFSPDKEYHGFIYAMLIVALIMAFSVNALIYFGTDALGNWCRTVAVLKYFTGVLAATWYTVVAFHHWIHNRTHGSPRWIKYYMMFGFLLPLTLTMVVVAVSTSYGDSKLSIGNTTCWFDDNVQEAEYFYTPVTLLLLINLACYISDVRYTCGVSDKDRIRRCVGRIILTGLPWIYTVFLFFTFELRGINQHPVWDVLDAVITGLTGVYVFVVLATDKQTWKIVASRTSDSLSARLMSQPDGYA